MPEPEEFTGERFLPECTGEIWAEHWHRYLFAAQHVEGLDVLDIASGEGYGSSLLGKRAKSVVGVDIDGESVANARARYGNARVRFETGSVAAIPFPDASFDCVVSFETLEHVTEHEEMLSELKRVLRPSGFVIISTPNRIEYSDKRDFRNEFHVRELDGPEFRASLGRYFGAQRWYGQRLLFNSGLWPIAERPTDEHAIRAEWVSVDDSSRPLPDPMYFIAFAAASAERLPSSTSVATLLGDPDDTIYREYESTVARTRALEQHLADRERIVVERDEQIASLDEQKRQAEALISGRDVEIAALDAQKRTAESLIAERDGQLDAVNARLRKAEALIADRERVVVERDRQIGLLDAQKRAAETLLADRERVIVERDAQLVALNARNADAERLIAAREQIVVERDAQLAALDAQKRTAEALIAERERIIVERDGQLAALDAQKRTIETQVIERERIIVERDQQMEALLNRVTHIESLVAERDGWLAATNARMAEAEQVIALRDRTLVDREQQLAIAEQRASGLEALAQARVQRIDALERSNNGLQTEVSRRASWRWWLALPMRRMRGTVPKFGSAGDDR